MIELEEMLAQSRAADDFKRAVRCFESGSSGEHIQIEGHAPPIKVRRVLTHILATQPHLPIERIAVRARSGCSTFIGTVHVHTSSETRVFEFVWDCRWRAEQEGWTDCFGFPDQARAAREFDWQCFRTWEQREN